MAEKCKLLSGIKPALIAALTAALLWGQPAPAVQASPFDILLQGLLQYAYLQQTLTHMHYHESDKIFNNYKQEYGVSQDAAANRQLDAVMNRLLTVIDPQGAVKPKFSWFVNNEKSFNAFCGLGNTVSVNIGLFEALNYNEDELAFVLAHEINHGLKQHSLKSLPKIVSAAVAQALYQEKNPNTASAIAGTIASRQLVATYATLPQEQEADANSFTYAVNAGYNPGAGAAIWARIAAKNGGQSRTAFESIVNPNDHPTNQQRIDYFSQRLTEHSRQKVRVKGGAIYVNGKPWLTPPPAGGLLAAESAYLIAGNLAAVFHANPSGGRCLVDETGALTINGRLILEPVHIDESPAAVAEQLNAILGDN